MKTLFKYFMMATLAMTTVALSGCTKDDPKPDPEPEPAPAEPTINPDDYTPSGTYTVTYEGDAIDAGNILSYAVSAAELEDNFIKVDFKVNNNSSEAQSTAVSADLIYGPESFREIGICILTCQNGTAPFTCTPVNIAAGGEQNVDIEVFAGATGVYHSAIYKITVGKGQLLLDPQVFFLKLTF